MYLFNTVTHLKHNNEDVVIDTLFFAYMSLELSLRELNKYSEKMKKEYKSVSYEFKLINITEINKDIEAKALISLGAKVIYVGMGEEKTETPMFF